METNNDNKAEKLIVIPERIIHILLKHLMLLKNENAYIKNKAALNSFENSITENSIGINNVQEGIAENSIGINNVQEGITENSIGINNVTEGIAENSIGINNITEGIAENSIGINNVQEGITEKIIGINNVPEGIAEKSIGIKSIFKALPDLKEGINTDSSLYAVFEQGLINALNQYIKTGDGQNTLYKYYSDFVEAVTEKNSEEEKIKAAAVNLQLEDTHILPAQIILDVSASQKLRAALQGYLPRTARHGLYKKVASELLLLHNNGKATGTELREYAGLSVAGFAKHLPKLKRSGLIKKQPPGNYVLTEISIHILLKTFGTPKNK